MGAALSRLPGRPASRAHSRGRVRPHCRWLPQDLSQMTLVIRLVCLVVAVLVASESRDLATSRSGDVSRRVRSPDTSRDREIVRSRDSTIVRVAGFGDVTVYQPAGVPSQVVLFVSGDGGWNLGVVSMAERLRDMGALVAGIDIRRFMRSMETSKRCAYPA